MLPFDVAVRRGEKVVVVECDGRQHFEDVDRWHSTVAVQLQRDTYKAFCALRNKTSIVRIRQEDVRGGTWTTWQTRLVAAVNKALDATEPMIEYLAMEPILYDHHKEHLARALDAGCAFYSGDGEDSGDED
jgi:hypothetical protein